MIWLQRLSVVFLLALALATSCTPPAPTATPAPTDTPQPPATLPRPTPTVGALPERAGTPAEQGRLRIVQAAPQSGAVDVYLEQALLASRLALGAYTNPITVESGVYLVQVVPAGALPSTQVLAETTLNIIPEQSFLVVITGVPDTLTISVFQEDLSPISGGLTRLAFLHAVPRGPAFTPRLDSQPFNEQLDFGQVSAGYLVDPGAHRLAFYGGDTFLADIDAALAPQQMYTAVLIGDIGGGNYRTLLFNTPVETPGRIRFIHAGLDIPAVNVFLDDQPIATALAYHAASEWLTQKPRAYQLRVERNDIEPGSRPLVDMRFTLNADQALELLLLRDRGVPALRIYPVSLAPTPPLRSRLVVVNAAPDAPTVYALSGGEQLAGIPPISYGMATGVIELPIGTFNLLWSTGSNADGRVVEFPGEFVFEEGVAYTYIVTGTDDAPFALADSVGVEVAPQMAFGVDEESQGSDVLNLRVINALAEPLDVRVRLDDSVLIESLPPREASAYLTVRPDRYMLRVGPAGPSPNVPDYYIGEISLLNQTRASLLLYGNPDTMRVSLAPDYSQAVQSGQAILRIFHAIPELDNLTASIALPGIAPAAEPPASAEGTPIYIPETPPGRFETYETSAFGPGQNTGFIGLPQGTYDIHLARTSDSQVVLIVPHLALQSRTLYDLLLLPGEAQGAFDVQLLVNETAR